MKGIDLFNKTSILMYDWFRINEASKIEQINQNSEIVQTTSNRLVKFIHVRFNILSLLSYEL